MVSPNPLKCSSAVRTLESYTRSVAKTIASKRLGPLCLCFAALSASPRKASPAFMATSTPTRVTSEADVIVSSLDLTLLPSAFSLRYFLESASEQVTRLQECEARTEQVTIALSSGTR